MSSGYKVLGISFKLWWILFIAINTLIIGLMIATLTVPKWVSSDFDSNDGFKGGLMKSHQLDLNTVDEDDTYEDLSDYFCERYDLLKDISDDSDVSETSLNLFKSFCNMFDYLEKAGRAFVALECTACVLVLGWTLIMVLYYFKGNGLVLTYLFSTVALALHVIAIIIYIVISNTKFGSCDDFPRNGDDPELCAEDGPALFLATLAILALQNILFFIVSCKIKRSGGHQTLNGNASNHSKNSGNVQNQIMKLDNTQFPKVTDPKTQGKNEYSNSNFN
jgi:hypothetical protein